MAIRLHVKRGQQSIVPLRFCRAVTGDPPVRDAPDVDVRGFNMGPMPGTWGDSDAAGAMVGIMVGDTIRVRILREDIENAGDLYVTSTNTDIVDVISPVNGGPVPNSGIFSIRGRVDRRNSPVKIQVHYGSDSGPVIGELEPHIFQRIRLRIAVHLVNIYGTDTNRRNADANITRNNITNLINGVNDIWRPAGIEFRTDNMQIIHDEVRRNPANAVRSQYFHRGSGSWRSLPAPLGAAGNFVSAGTITSNSTWGAGGADEYREFDTLINLNFVANRVNIYCVHTSAEWNATSASYTPDWNGLSYVGLNRGIAIVDVASNYGLAHELGHYLNNNHADENAAGNDADNKEIWLVRRLMYSGWPDAAPAYRNDVGYGADQYGALISVKQLGGDYSNQDGELARSRRRARNPFT